MVLGMVGTVVLLLVLTGGLGLLLLLPLLLLLGLRGSGRCGGSSGGSGSRLLLLLLFLLLPQLENDLGLPDLLEKHQRHLLVSKLAPESPDLFQPLLSFIFRQVLKIKILKMR